MAQRPCWHCGSVVHDTWDHVHDDRVMVGEPSIAAQAEAAALCADWRTRGLPGPIAVTIQRHMDIAADKAQQLDWLVAEHSATLERVAELDRQVTELQTRGTELVLERRACGRIVHEIIVALHVAGRIVFSRPDIRWTTHGLG